MSLFPYSNLRNLFYLIGELSIVADFFKHQLYPNNGYIGLSFDKIVNEMLSKSRAICIAKLLATGINQDIAEQIVCSDIGDSKYQYVLDAIADGKHFLIGDFGAGKSHLLSILSQQLMQNYLNGDRDVLPLFVQAKELARIGSIQQWLKDLQLENTIYLLLVDGLDEIDYNVAKQIVEEVNILSIQYPHNSILVGSRPLNMPGMEKNITIHPLTDKECLELYDTVSESREGEHAFRWIDENMKRVLSRPLFCIIFALFKSEPRSWAKNDLDLITALVDKSLQKAGPHFKTVSADISKIAAKSVDRNFGDVHISEIQFSGNFDDIIKQALSHMKMTIFLFICRLLLSGWQRRQSGRRLFQ